MAQLITLTVVQSLFLNETLAEYKMGFWWELFFNFSLDLVYLDRRSAISITVPFRPFVFISEIL